MKIAQLASQGTLPVISVKMFSGSWEIDERKYEIIICGLNNTAFKRSIQETFCMTLHQIYAKLSKNENATQKQLTSQYVGHLRAWAPILLLPLHPGLAIFATQEGKLVHLEIWKFIFGIWILELARLWATRKSKQSRHFPYLFVCLFPVYLSHQIPESQARPPDVMRQ